MSYRNRYQVLTTDQADVDLEDIYLNGLQTRGEDEAEEYDERLHQAIESLRSFPGIGRNRPDLFPGCKTLHEGAHLIIYRIDGNKIYVERVVHARMDLPGLFPN